MLIFLFETEPRAEERDKGSVENTIVEKEEISMSIGVSVILLQRLNLYRSWLHVSFDQYLYSYFAIISVSASYWLTCISLVKFKLVADRYYISVTKKIKNK